jgi:hypothetical protein
LNIVEVTQNMHETPRFDCHGIYEELKVLDKLLCSDIDGCLTGRVDNEK